jgi:hypothetical protein
MPPPPDSHFGFFVRSLGTIRDGFCAGRRIRLSLGHVLRLRFADEEIRVRHLERLGDTLVDEPLTYEFFTTDPALKQAYHDANVYDYGQTLAEMVTKLSKLPLAHQIERHPRGDFDDASEHIRGHAVLEGRPPPAS